MTENTVKTTSHHHSVMCFWTSEPHYSRQKCLPLQILYCMQFLQNFSQRKRRKNTIFLYKDIHKVIIVSKKLKCTGHQKKVIGRHISVSQYCDIELLYDYLCISVSCNARSLLQRYFFYIGKHSPLTAAYEVLWYPLIWQRKLGIIFFSPNHYSVPSDKCVSGTLCTTFTS